MDTSLSFIQFKQIDKWNKTFELGSRGLRSTVFVGFKEETFGEAPAHITQEPKQRTFSLWSASEFSAIIDPSYIISGRVIFSL